MKQYTIEKLTVEKAVNWWVNRITGNEAHDNGDNSFASVMSCVMADLGRKKITTEQINIFKENLSEYIAERYKDFGRLELYCDYGPGVGLSESADAAGINYLNFPFKTGMSISDNIIRVSNGYGKPYVEI